MKLMFLIACFPCLFASGQNIVFTNRTETFTNLQGQLFKSAELLRADPSGLVWKTETGAGRIVYTNLDDSFLVKFGIPTNWIVQSAQRAAAKAKADAQYRSEQATAFRQMMAEKQKEMQAWIADAPNRERKAQMEADLQKIQAFAARVSNAEKRVRYANAVTPTGASGSPEYVDSVMAQRSQVNLAAEQVTDATVQLGTMVREFEEKYGVRPKQQ